MRALLLAAGILALGSASCASAAKLEVAAGNVYTLNVTSYEFSDCTGQTTGEHVVKEGECVKTRRGYVSARAPPSESAECVTVLFCRNDYYVRDDVVCGACNGHPTNALSDTKVCNAAAKTVDFHFYNNMGRKPERCTHDRYNTLGVPVDGVCRNVVGLGSLKLTGLAACTAVGYSVTLDSTECPSEDTPASLGTMHHVVPNLKCTDGLRVARSFQ